MSMKDRAEKILVLTNAIEFLADRYSRGRFTGDQFKESVLLIVEDISKTASEIINSEQNNGGEQK